MPLEHTKAIGKLSKVPFIVEFSEGQEEEGKTTKCSIFNYNSGEAADFIQ